MSTYDSSLLATVLANIHYVRAQNAVILSMLSKMYADDYNTDVDTLHKLQQDWIRDKAKEYGERDMEKMDQVIELMQKQFMADMPDMPIIDLSKFQSNKGKTSEG